MRLICSAILISAFAHMANAADCPAPDGSPVWLIAGCEIASDPPELRSRVMSRQGEDVFSTWDLLAELVELGAVIQFDWEEDTSEIIGKFDNLLGQSGLAPFDDGEVRTLQHVGDTAWGNSTPIVDMSPFIERMISKRGKVLIDIDTQSDTYSFTIMTPQMACRWINVTLGPNFTMVANNEDVGLLSYDPSSLAVNTPKQCEVSN